MEHLHEHVCFYEQLVTDEGDSHPHVPANFEDLIV